MIEDLGYELWHLERVGPAAERILRLYIDAPEGVTVDDCEAVSHEVSSLLDVEQAQGNRAADYGRLEVSSPGLDRPLMTVAHFARFVGESAQVTLYAPVEGRRRLQGVIRDATDETVELEVDGRIFSLAITDVAKARLDPEI